MIRVNLLPVEKRKVERTPLPRFFLLIGNVIAASVLGFVILGMLFGINQIKGETEDLKREAELLKPDLAVYEKLKNQEKALADKIREIDSVVARDVKWWRAVNALWDVIHDNEKVWIDDVRVLPARQIPNEMKKVDPKITDMPPYGISLKCHVAGSEVTAMTRFREDLKSHPVLQEVLSQLNFNPDWTVDDEPDFQEAHSVAFLVRLFGPVKASAASASAEPVTKKGRKK